MYKYELKQVAYNNRHTDTRIPTTHDLKAHTSNCYTHTHTHTHTHRPIDATDREFHLTKSI